MARRHELATNYTNLFSEIANVKSPSIVPGAKHVFYLYVIRTNMRDGLRKHLTENNIETGIHYPIPIHKQKPYLQFGGSFPITERVSAEILSLPMHPGLSNEDVENVVLAINAFFK